ncbi:MAG: response regulator transcription factor [Candidatus Villigracilaceae bacterium]
MRILIIEDDSGITDLVQQILRTQGYEVFSTSNGDEGIQMIRDKAPDLVIRDLMLPHQDGWDVCKAIRAFSNVPIMIMSALNGAVYIANALDMGADDYLVKPVSNNILLARVKRLLQRSAENRRASSSLYRQASSWVSG